MANEATIRTSLQISKGNLQYQSQPTAFRATVEGSKGPTPGAVTVPTTGVDIDLSELTTPGLCRMQNLDTTNYVEWGVHDGSVFHPVGELQPGETYVHRLSRNLGEEHVIAGTGTTGTVNTLHFKANTASCIVIVEAFER